jgi:alanyl-tRNA synthetase
VSADALVKAGAVEIAGRGGGRPQMGQAKGTAGDGLGRALEAIRGALEASG